MLAWQLRTNLRHNRARIYVANHREIKLLRQAKASLTIAADGYAGLVTYLAGDDKALAANDNSAAFRKAILAEEKLVIVFGAEYPRPRCGCAGEVRPRVAGSEVRMSGRLCEFARRGGYGPAAGYASWVRAGFAARAVR